MSWSTFEITADYIRQKEPEVFPTFQEDVNSGWSDADLVSLQQTQAKRDMLLDLTLALKCEEDDLDDVLTTHETRLKEALSCKQLALYFAANDMGAGSLNNEKMKYYSKCYSDYKRQFNSLIADNYGINSSSARIVR